ncbi:MAG TPA: hypothetical protein PLH98_19900 [Ruminococcus flavefaciens]|nr:hypothetical protein [Ruminococcus flavefaciens]HQM02777.1 hypothetical protein [Ruminococcus flavefaciens]
MRKLFILFSAIVMAAALATGCGNTTSTSSSTPVASQIESYSEAETKPKELIDIDPFEGVDFSFKHDYDGKVIEKFESSNQTLETTPVTVVFLEGSRTIQRLSDNDAIKKCEELGFELDVYREVLPEDLKEGDIVTYRLITVDNYPENELQDRVKEKYGINLTQITKDVTVHFEEDPVEECDPFEGVTFDYYPVESDGNVFVYYDTNINECDGAKMLADRKCPIGFEEVYPDGKDVDSITEGDVVKFILYYTPDQGETIYRGDEAKEKIEENQ